jgi:hypothetical protein
MGPTGQSECPTLLLATECRGLPTS